MTDFKDNDVFIWTYNPKNERSFHEALKGYGCKSQIAVAKGGKLYDTYWSAGENFHVNPAQVDLDRLGNLDDYEQAGRKKLEHYSPDDILDLRHGNSSSHPDLSPVYLRKGSVKSAEVMKCHLQEKLTKAQREQASAFRAVENAREMIRRVEAGYLEKVWL